MATDIFKRNIDRRYLARTVIHKGLIYNLAVLFRSQNKLEILVEKFNIETPATLFIDYPIAAVSRKSLSDSVLSQLNIISSVDKLIDNLKDITYLQDDSPDIIILLKPKSISILD